VVGPTAKRLAVGLLRRDLGISLRRACRVVALSTATWQYHRTPDPAAAALEVQLREQAAARPRFGYRRLHTLLRRVGWQVNHKRLYRVYRAAGLQVRRRHRKRRLAGDRIMLPPLTARGQRWSMDFLRDTLADARPFRTLNIVDDFTRECVAIEVDRSLPGARVVRVLERLLATVGLPAMIVVDNELPLESSVQIFSDLAFLPG
jgi:putative transposase